MLLAASRRLPEVAADRSWRPREVSLLAGAVIGIVGAGGIGQAVIRLLAPFGAHTIALTRSRSEVPGATESVGPDDLESLLRRSDFLVLAAAETDETVGLLSAERLALLPAHAWIVNVGRGSILDTDALVEALHQQRLGGAALDVTTPEPLPDDHPLWQLPNALITSHTASTPRLGREQLALRITTNVGRFGRGEPLLGTVDVDLGY